MMNKLATKTSVSRANTVLMFGRGGNAKAVISSVVVGSFKHKTGERMRFSGPVRFEKKTVSHIREVILPSIDHIFNKLNLPTKCFDISIVNLDAAAINDIGLNIAGFSADVSIFLAMLSSGLQMTIPEDMVFTGHLASTAGDIRMVSGLPAKLAAAIACISIHSFVCPSIGQDDSLVFLSPGEQQRIIDAFAKARHDLDLVAVRDIGELVENIFPDDRVALASLKHGFFNSSDCPSASNSPIERVIEFLAGNGEKRFWSSLERLLLAGQSDEAKELLSALSRFYIHRKMYPKNLGSRLLRLMWSVPPDTRRLKLNFPLLSVSKCIQISKFTAESDYDDVLLLFKAATGEKIGQSLNTGDNRVPSEDINPQPEGANLQSILSEINAEALSRISLPLDSARSTYVMDSVIATSHDEFIETITAFFVHLLRYTQGISEPVNLHLAEAEAISLIDRAFSAKGGFQTALSEAKLGTQGGLRFIFDQMTEQFKKEEKEKYVNHVLKSALDPLDWDKRVSLIAEMIKRLEPNLSPEILSQSHEKFAVHYEVIVKAYVQSMDKVQYLFSSL